MLTPNSQETKEPTGKRLPPLAPLPPASPARLTLLWVSSASLIVTYKVICSFTVLLFVYCWLYLRARISVTFEPWRSYLAPRERLGAGGQGRTDSESVGVAASVQSVPLPPVPRLTSVPCLRGRPGLISQPWPRPLSAARPAPSPPREGLDHRRQRRCLAGFQLSAACPPPSAGCVAGLCLARVCPGRMAQRV